jgi:two-component system KDP operon response regulator KdpE
VDLAALHHPDLLLLDIHMPQLDGVEALREIRGIEGLGGTPAIMLSGLSQPDEVAASARAGASDYIIKMGFDLKAFLARIRKALTGQPA